MRGALFSIQKETFLEMAHRHRVNFAGVESVMYQKALYQEIMREFESWQNAPPLIPILHGSRNKITRIATLLQPLFKNDRLKFHHLDYETKNQFADFPLGRHDDIPDAVAMAISLLPPEPEGEMFHLNPHLMQESPLPAYF